MIAICPNPYRDHRLECTRKCRRLLEEAGFTTLVCSVFPCEENCIPEDIVCSPFSALDGSCTLVVVIGGDGTILSAVHNLPNTEIPVIGVNLGTMGFMAAVSPDHLEQVVQAARGQYPLSRRMLLDVTLERGRENVYTGRALNDAVIHGYGDCVNIQAYCDGSRIMRFSGDGIIVSTPTGSTGYSLSAGGPIVEPDAENFVVTPICAHSLGSKSYVLSPRGKVTVETEVLVKRRAYLSVDGSQVSDIFDGDILRITRSRRYIYLPDPGTCTFYELVYQKLPL